MIFWHALALSGRTTSECFMKTACANEAPPVAPKVIGAPITPAVLKWVREEAGFSLAQTAARVGIAASSRGQYPTRNGAERLANWEEGRDRPTLQQLTKIAKKFHRPLITFFLPAPPRKSGRLFDFRTLPGTENRHDSPEFAALKRRSIHL